MSGLACPVCQGELRETLREGVSIDVCARCRGVWLDRGELEKLAAALSGGEPPPRQEAGFWQSHQQPRGAPHAPPSAERHAPRGAEYWRDDDDDDRRRHGGPRHSRLSRLMDFFD
jgi:hypothetical protein